MRAPEASTLDLEFARAFEAGEVGADDFDHRVHVRLAYVYLCDGTSDQAHERMKASLLGFLRRLGADEAKYHETMTRAWILAVRHFMESCDSGCRSADEFIARNPSLLDSKIMLSHYSCELLFSTAARATFVEPDFEPIPEH